MRQDKNAELCVDIWILTIAEGEAMVSFSAPVTGLTLIIQLAVTATRSFLTAIRMF